MSKALQAKIDELFEVTKDLKSLDAIKPMCEQFNEWVNQQSYTEKSLGTLFSRYGLYSKFRSVPLEQGLNAELVPKCNADGSIKNHELKHYVSIHCGLDNKQWHDRNKTTRAIDRLENPTEIDPDTYLEVTGKLLESNDPHELAVGLVAATGRRPHEILARAKFTPVEGKPYHVMFEGQGKKRGEKPVFEIATLYPAEFVTKCLARLRRDPSIKALLKEVAAEFPGNLTKQNVVIGNRRNRSLLRVVAEYFGDKGDKTPVMAFRHGDEHDNNKALRAAYAVLATKRDCKGSAGSEILHAARLLGHITGDIKDDKQLGHIATTAGYSDYFVIKPVGFPMIQEKEKVGRNTIRVTPTDFEALKHLQEAWSLPNQQSVINRLLENQEKVTELGKRLLEANTRINQLEKEKVESSNKLVEANARISHLERNKTEMPQASPSSPSTPSEPIEETIERVLRKLQLAPSVAPAEQVVTPSGSKPIKPVAVPKATKEPEAFDWSSTPNDELWANKSKGASSEKVRRSYEAICLYNDTIATGDNDRIAITNLGIRELSGVNGLLIRDWLADHVDEVISHHSKYEMLNSKDPSKVETYYNKRHGAEKVSSILNLIKEKLLNRN